MRFGSIEVEEVPSIQGTYRGKDVFFRRERLEGVMAADKESPPSILSLQEFQIIGPVGFIACMQNRL